MFTYLEEARLQMGDKAKQNQTASFARHYQELFYAVSIVGLVFSETPVSTLYRYHEL